MIVVNIFEAKAKLSEYLDMAAHGERVLICKRNRPVVELHAVGSARTTPRPVGLGRGRMTVPPSFFEPLPEDDLNGFEGAVQASAGPMHVEANHRSGLLNVAEGAPDGGFDRPPKRRQ
jgi:antitoxin (DNA-binding transcriptional repressor) of toxin-antitoxin stability system